MTDHAHELRRHARKIPHPQGETPGVMLRAADEIERLQSVIAGLLSDFETAHERMMTSAAAEREACAKAIENSVDGFHNNSDWADGYIQAAKDIADGIRARGDADAP